MDFGFLPPPSPLAHIVKTVWFARGSRSEFAHAEPIVPDGCVELVFNLGEAFEQVDGAGLRQRQPRDLLIGPSLQPTTAVPTGDVDLLGLRLRPGRTSAFFQAPMSSLTDRLIPISSVLPGASRVLDNLCEQRVEQRLHYLGDVFGERARRFGKRGSLAAVATALHEIETHRGAVSIKTLAAAAGVSSRHLERQFREEVGLGAKHVARISRVQHALSVMAGNPSWSGADVAAWCGYADQAHLIREFTALTGSTPARLTTTSHSLAAFMRRPQARS
jgi:AraC-like DNA-binding protein